MVGPPEGHGHAPVTSPAPGVVQADAHGERERPEADKQGNHSRDEGAQASNYEEHGEEDDERHDTKDCVTDHPVPAAPLGVLASSQTLGSARPDVGGSDRCVSNLPTTGCRCC